MTLIQQLMANHPLTPPRQCTAPLVCHHIPCHYLHHLLTHPLTLAQSHSPPGAKDEGGANLYGNIDGENDSSAGGGAHYSSPSPRSPTPGPATPQDPVSLRKYLAELDSYSVKELKEKIAALGDVRTRYLA